MSVVVELSLYAKCAKTELDHYGVSGTKVETHFNAGRQNMFDENAVQQLLDVTSKSQIPGILEPLTSDLIRFRTMEEAVSRAKSNKGSDDPIHKWLEFYETVYRGQVK